ncbi:unnamed protein product [Phaeothamnion confervicola]
MNESISMRGMSYVPLDPQWMTESPAFQSGNPALVRAFVKLLTYAWQAVPAGTVPSSFRVIGDICGLTEQQVGDHHAELFEGWELHEGRLRFMPLYALCGRVSARYADVLGQLQDQAAGVMQAPEEFELRAPEVVTSAKKGKHRLPKDWKPSERLRQWLSEHDFITPEDCEFIVEKFTSHFHANGEMRLNWDDSFRNYALKENRLNLPSRRLRMPPVSGAGGGRAARFGAAGVASQAHNASVLSGAAQRAGHRGENCHA